ncbi:DNA sulfur modification protein DndE [Pontibacterium sp.]|uniref:DNA sulfur modification protein DndE n=1 Tax=Pontibacterium sp. TaxID=2036026 RepID=UPI003515C02D
MALPNDLRVTKQTEDQLRRLKQYTGLTNNVIARIGFMRSMEKGYTYRENKVSLDGNLVLNKHTWLGDTSQYTELLLKQKYPDFDQTQMLKAWAAHVEEGIASIRNLKSIGEFSAAL